MFACDSATGSGSRSEWLCYFVQLLQCLQTAHANSFFIFPGNWYFFWKMKEEYEDKHKFINAFEP